MLWSRRFLLLCFPFSFYYVLASSRQNGTSFGFIQGNLYVFVPIQMFKLVFLRQQASIVVEPAFLAGAGEKEPAPAWGSEVAELQQFL